MVWHNLNLTLSLIETKEWEIFFLVELESLYLLVRLFFLHFLKALPKCEVLFCCLEL